MERRSYHFMWDTGRMLLGVNEDQDLLEKIRRLIEFESTDRVLDLHVWRVGPCHYAAILSVNSSTKTTPAQ